MRLLQRSDAGEFSLTKDLDSDKAIPPYAIVPHTWGADTEEVTFEDLTSGIGQDKPGYEKIRFCGEQARQDSLQYFWIDTCCINKTNYAELSQAIKSMFRWYRNATRCYVYLSDVPLGTDTDKINPQSWDSEFWKSRWFTRGWTLQEFLAPRSVELFSRKRERLGDKNTLKQQIHNITGVLIPALQGAPLSQFSVDERFSWMECRQTTLEVDRVYSLLGILDAKIPILKEIEAATAFGWLREKRIEDTKGGLLEDSYRWILENPEFKQWHSAQQSPLLWIKGDPGKGKTMLLCGIINELDKPTVETALLSYFFCQANDSRINNATAVLRGHIYMLISQQPSLISLAKLLDLIVQTSESFHVKWIVSSRNWPDIEERLVNAGQNLSLELNAESVSAAVSIFIKHKVLELAQRKKHKDKNRDEVLVYLSSNANGTFLWVALVCRARISAAPMGSYIHKKR
ncbi:heterokaryon incompatibility protein-domain-containing protein [Amylocarpus encephaloides]|uniref:Heterokaryon incompatibility protein-domain-containing protein n=1 Tax=Amylocarpus encephaloides TaxID=45428 RepID=A0A9P7Y6M1_9HELO|nr:heterokaryon incompatibility protein-domain-containing protein [Amylocarpus encephaloides]